MREGYHPKASAVEVAVPNMGGEHAVRLHRNATESFGFGLDS
jgi:hypothetical protein